MRRTQPQSTSAPTRPSRRERGQATAEYALVILGAAALALLVIAWAANTSAVGDLMDAVLDSVRGRVGMTGSGRARPPGPADAGREADRADPARAGEGGQATVEAALLLPVIALALLAVIQIGLVVHARVMVTHAAREGVRAAAVHRGDGEVREAVIASGGLAPDRLSVTTTGTTERVTVVVRYEAPTNVPLIGPLIGDVELVGEATMRRED